MGLRVEQQMVEKKDKISNKEEYLREIEDNIKKAVSLKEFLKADKLKKERDTARKELKKMVTDLVELEEELKRINEEMASSSCGHYGTHCVLWSGLHMRGAWCSVGLRPLMREMEATGFLSRG